MPVPTVPTNGNGPPASGAISRTQSFAPITPVVKERVGDVAFRLSEVEKIIEDINTQSATTSTRSPSMSDLNQEIDLLKKDIDRTKDAQKKQIDALKDEVKNNVKKQITESTKTQIEARIRESVEAQVKIEMGEWGQSATTKALVENLRKMVHENDALHHEARVKLDNSRSRHNNSTLDEHADLETALSIIKLPDGSVSKAYPRTLQHLFLYDEEHLLQLFDDYSLRRLDTHLDNLNRFLGFIGLRFSIPQQSLDFLDHPPAYPSSNVLESSKGERPHNVSSASPQNQGDQKTETQEVQSEHEETTQEPAATNNEPVQTQTQEEKIDEKQAEERQEVKSDHGGQQPIPVDNEVSTFLRRQSAGAMNQQPFLQQTTPTFPTRATNRASLSYQPSPQHNPQGQGNRGANWWSKTWGGE